MKFKDLTIVKTHKGLLKKQFSAFELTKYFLYQIEKLDKKINAYLTISQDLALLQAKKIDETIFKGNKISVLSGIPFSVKDNILVKGIKCTAGSKILENYIATYDATVIQRLKEKEAIILGKTNLDEFAMGSSTENSAFLKTKNPHNLDMVPGGSSGGSTSSVAANMCIFSLGSDTGGSIRQPASFCGVVGLKPTYGAVSRYGLIAFASSLDQIGPITKTVEDCEIVFRAIAGRDKFDSTSAQFSAWNPKSPITNIKIGVPKEYFIEGIDRGVKELIKKTIKKFQQAKMEIMEISLPHTEYALLTYYIVATSEASSNLARYDGIRYGKSKTTNQKSKVKNLLDVYFKTKGEGFGSEVKRRIMLGTYSLSAGYYEAYYLRAQKVRAKIKEDFEKAFKIVDVILTPTSPTPAFKLGEKIDEPLKMYLSDIFTVTANLAGLPALSLNCGYLDNLPVGFQLIGKPFKEQEILELGKMYENL